jgi:uncharacterized membrane protein
MSDDRKRAAYERTHDPSRVMTLSDGVFAIIITLLVLEIHVPELSHGQSLGQALQEIRPSFVAFLISFVVVAISWAGHRDLFAHVRRTDRPLVWLNILYLLPLSILPFGASLIARYDTWPVALELYGFLLLAISATRIWIFWYGTGHPHLLYEPTDPRSRRLGALIVVIPAVAYGAAVVLADASPRTSLWIYAIVPLLYFLGLLRTRWSAPPGWESNAG